MTTIKIKLRTSTIDGKPATIYYQLSHERKIRQITTQYHINPEEWDEEQENLRKDSPYYAILHAQINRDMTTLDQIIQELELTFCPYDVEEVVKRFKNPEKDKYVLAYMQQQIDYLKREKRFGTAKNYNSARNSFSHFLNGKDIPFSLFNEDLINEYNLYLKDRDIMRNSISFYMRILRAVHNKAIRQHYAAPTNPFMNVYTGVDHTRKRAVNEKLILELYKLQLPKFSPLDLARDIFIFSYCTRGMAFVDIVKLKKKEIRNGMICYSRQKTNQPLSIKIEKQIRDIIDKYAPRTKHSRYVFPILKGDDLNEDYKRYQKALNTMNRMLDKLSGMLSQECKLTSYVARHSWATTARNHNIPISIISAGLGHSSEKTTQIYLNMLENSIIDSANLEILNLLC